MEEDLTPPVVEMKGCVEERLQEDALWRRCKEREGDGGVNRGETLTSLRLPLPTQTAVNSARAAGSAAVCDRSANMNA